MRFLFMTVERQAFAESIKPYKQFIQAKDRQLYPVTSTAIFNDEDRKLPALMIAWQGVSKPEGAADLINQRADFEVTVQEVYGKKVRISRYWWRRTLFWLWVWFRMVVICFVLGVGTWILGALLF